MVYNQNNWCFILDTYF